jgi:sulfatase maturation enzyme AslB (radical SAM superfamily)
MKKLIEIKNNKPKLLKLMYDLGNTCNYKCWYCFPGSNTGTDPFPDVEVVKYNLVRILDYYYENGINEIQLNFLGGEPTLWADLGTLIEYVSNNVKRDPKKHQLRITMQTNGSRTLRWWKEYGQYFDHVSVSVHHERVDVDHVCKVADILIEKKVSFLATVLMDHSAWDKCRSLVDRLIEYKTKFIVLAKPIHVNGEVNYTEEQREYLNVARKKNPSLYQIWEHLDKWSKLPKYTAIFDDGTKENVRTDHYFIMNMLNRFKGWECTLSINWLQIMRDGNLTGTCRQKLFGLDYYYNINDPDFINKFNPTLQPVICEQTMCTCAGEAVLTKKAPNVN